MHVCISFVDVSGTELTSTPPAPQSTSGNGVIAQPKKIRGVGFGDIFQGGSVKLRARLPSPESEDKKDKVSQLLLLMIISTPGRRRSNRARFAYMEVRGPREFS